MMMFAVLLLAALSEIKVDLRLDAADFVIGERVRGVVDIANSSPAEIDCGSVGSPDRLLVEIFRAGDMSQLTKVSRSEFVAAFTVKTGEGQKLETFLADHYDLSKTSRYLAKPVLVHNGMRYEGMLRAFDIVDGIKVGSAMQMFKSRPGVQREFALVYWSRKHGENLFLTAMDVGRNGRRWETRDLGPILRIDKPSISILESGEVVVLHRLNQDHFVRTVFWSLPRELVFRTREAVQDPETAGTQRVRELYKEGGVKPKENPWWKFW